MRVVVYEPTPTGHHFAYLSHVLPEFANLVDEVILVTTPAAAKSQQFVHHLAAHADRFALDTSIGDMSPKPSFGRTIQSVMKLKRAAARLRPDHVCVPYGDEVAPLIGIAPLCGMRPWSREVEAEVLLFLGGYQYSAMSYRRAIAHRITPRAVALGPWNRVHHVNPDDLEALRRCETTDAGRYRLMPDPVESPPDVTKEEARRQLGIPDVGRYIGCAGGIDRRKGIHLLVRAFLSCRDRLRADDRLLLAGPVHAEIRAILDDEAHSAVREERIVVVDRPLSTHEFGLALISMDLVCTPYPAHPYSASTVIRAASCGRPVLGAAIGWMQRTISQFALGATCNVLDQAAFCDALVRARWGRRIRSLRGRPAVCRLPPREQLQGPLDGTIARAAPLAGRHESHRLGLGDRRTELTQHKG